MVEIPDKMPLRLTKDFPVMDLLFQVSNNFYIDLMYNFAS